MINRTKVKEWHIKFIIENARHKNDIELKNATGLSLSTIERLRRKNGIYRGNGAYDPVKKTTAVAMMEDYWCNYSSLKELSYKYGVNEATVGRYLNLLFKLPLNKGTEIITLQSKINGST